MAANESTCSGCGKPVVWIVTAARTLLPGEACTAGGRQSHFATCLKADSFRGPK